MKTPEEINRMTAEQLRERLRAIRCFMLDMDGTFYLGNQILPGSLEFLDAVERTGRQVLFLTNNSSKSADHYIQKLRGMNVREPFLNILTSGQAAARYCLEHFAGKKAFLLGNHILAGEFEKFGVPVDNEHPDYVVIAFDTELDYAKMCAVCDAVRSGLPYIATHPDYNCPTETGFIPDIGAIIAFIKASTGREPDLIIGKPYGGIVKDALQVTGLKTEQLAMCGDRLYTDIATGVNFGMTSILVMSGETTWDDLAQSQVKPHLIFGRLADMIPYLEKI